MKKFQSYDMDDALPVGAVEEGMEHGEDILPPMEGRSPLTEEMQGISPGHRNSEEQKKKGGWQNKEKRQPYDWELKGCETIEDSAEKEKFKKELEKKERQRQYYAKWYAKQKEKKEQEKAEKEKKAPKKQEKLTLEDLPAAMEELDQGDAKPVGALERLQKLREMAKNDDETESEAADLPDADEAAEEEAAADTDGEEGGEDAVEDGREDSEMDADERIAERAGEAELIYEVLTEASRQISEEKYHPVDYSVAYEMAEELAERAERAESRMKEKQSDADSTNWPYGSSRFERMYLKLSDSQVSNLRGFIEAHLFADIRSGDASMDWAADMCEIWRELDKWQKEK